jgi:hypothetical protein
MMRPGLHQTDERPPGSFFFFQDGKSAKTGLVNFHDQPCKQLVIIGYGIAMHMVVVQTVQVIRGQLADKFTV